MPAGAGAQELRKSLHHELHDQIRFTNCLKQVKVLTVVDSYRHLGTTVTCLGELHTEVTQKAAVIRSTVGGIRKKFLKNDAIETRVKTLICQALIFSRGLSQCGTWPDLPSCLFVKVHRAVMAVYRVAA
eukprot:7136354-Karenia_brevis.AAC.1